MSDPERRFAAKGRLQTWVGKMAFREITDEAHAPLTVGPRAEGGSFYTSFGKRAFDLGFGLAISPLVLPAIGVLWLLSRRDGGAGLFSHTRVGQNGREFRCLKIRTMVPDAEARLVAHLAADATARSEWARDVKLKQDPRVTKLGAFLRKSSLDELPQLFNVLRGDMSFVGPRPVPRTELDAQYGPKKDVYLALKPGITGLWQVSGRNDVSYARRIKLDARYLAKRSLGLDLKIMVKTVFAVLSRTGS